MEWECTRRKLLVKLFIKIGESLWVRGETQKAHKAFLKSISVLVNRSTFQSSELKIPFTLLAKLIERNVIRDIFAVEHAVVFYTVCWASLRSLCDYGRSNQSCDMLNFSIPTVVSGLKLSLTKCCEVPELFQKVSRLLAVLHTLAPSCKTFSMLDSSSSSLSVSQWASYFHQASLGANINCKLFSRRLWKQNSDNTMDVDSPSPFSSTSLSLHRLVSESVLDLEEFILKFFQGLPRASIICISILDEDYASWLGSVLPWKPVSQTWMMFSRLNSDCAPIVIVLPIDSSLTGNPYVNERKSFWYSQWGHTVDNIAPSFRKILEEWSLYSPKLEWAQLAKFDQRLKDFLRKMEDDWFGPWKVLLLGGLLGHKRLDRLQKNLREDLKSKCEIDIHENITKAVTRGGGQRYKNDVRKDETRRRVVECLSKLMMRKGCYIGGRECVNDGSKVFDLLSNTMNKIGDGDGYEDREPVILVLDLEIQMLPWESMPVLRDQEVYRMLSVASIADTCDKNCHFKETGVEVSSVYPMIDPVDAYYMMNPGGDLKTFTQASKWFSRRIRKGIVGAPLGVHEWRRVLKEHDLFIYAGHGSGSQYISDDEIKKLDRCAAIIYTGCSSGRLLLNGPYIPFGTPLSCLFAGSPIVIANLWNVTDDTVKFTKDVVEGWLAARLKDCEQCTSLRGCEHRPRVGSFMGKARAACRLLYRGMCICMLWSSNRHS